MVATAEFFTSDLYSLYNVIQNTQILYPKNLLVATLKEFFSQDTKYHFVADEFGFPKTPDHTDLAPEAGIYDDETTRIFIGQEHRFDIRYLPAVLVRHTGSAYNPISINQDEYCVQYGHQLYIDGYSNKYSIRVPVNFIFAGAWDLSFDIDIITEGLNERSEISEAVSLYLQSIARTKLTNAGLFIKSTRVSGETYELYQNRNIYKQTVSLDCRGEFRRLIPVRDVVEIINACIEIGHYESGAFVVADNMTIQHEVDLTNTLLNVTEL